VARVCKRAGCGGVPLWLLHTRTGAHPSNARPRHSTPLFLQTSWGMSLNKMQIFNWTHYRKIVFMDSDTLAFQVRRARW
jgi:hypothetical protein